MHSLVFFCAQKVISDHVSTRKALDYIPNEIYPVLFKAAFLDLRTLVVRDLVQRWPFSVLNFSTILRSCKHCDRDVIREKPNKQCLQAVIMGVKDYLTSELRQSRSLGSRKTKASTSQKDFKLRKHRSLRVVDLTGLQDDGDKQVADSIGQWSRTVALAKACIEVSRTSRRDELSSSKRRKGRSGAPLEGACENPICVEIHANLFVTSNSYGTVKDALQVGKTSPLCLKCRDLRAEELSAKKTISILELLDTVVLRKIELRYNNLGLCCLSTVFPSLPMFENLISLKLPYSNIDVRNMTPEIEESFQSMVSVFSQLPNVKELNLASCRLSGRISELLSVLQKPLESLELPYCFLLPADATYLANSHHAPFLRKLDLSGNNLSDVLLGPFCQILQQASNSLVYLDIMECRVMDQQLTSFLPALKHCSQLQYLSCFCNPISSQGLKTLLHTAVQLPSLKIVVHPIPVDCYEEGLPWPPSTYDLIDYSIDQQKLSRVDAELNEIRLKAVRTDIVTTVELYNDFSLDMLQLY
ncbi:leucine-rich repeat-containing protein 14-like isoform X1 [Hypanus sabinus]|uniref:leucine-rich repeat-containing protein 14-like isoform X1 n=1 Tax=Hypanus sabinus TaxID=79690 RepID=UPI0028C50618|nr:leucine-rich repeat-containing protein 14-like isoform X1 [Hypanus sabinus]XP_059827663.1 leucine-rich repeat-containing protein 14-like isoform X1 [Hypanus sabinus]